MYILTGIAVTTDLFSTYLQQQKYQLYNILILLLHLFLVIGIR